MYSLKFLEKLYYLLFGEDSTEALDMCRTDHNLKE